jgi:hypothetical protein
LCPCTGRRVNQDLGLCVVAGSRLLYANHVDTGVAVCGARVGVREVGDVGRQRLVFRAARVDGSSRRQASQIRRRCYWVCGAGVGELCTRPVAGRLADHRRVGVLNHLGEAWRRARRMLGNREGGKRGSERTRGDLNAISIEEVNPTKSRVGISGQRRWQRDCRSGRSRGVTRRHGYRTKSCRTTH